MSKDNFQEKAVHPWFIFGKLHQAALNYSKKHVKPGGV
jgi:hypothetical protein